MIVTWKAHTGRYYKRQLSKSRRRYIKQLLRTGRPAKESTHWESECNWKGM